MTCPRHFPNTPIDIYHIIHSFLSHYDYRRFTNSNKSDFEVVKHETVAYDIANDYFKSSKLGPLGASESKLDLEEAIVSAKKAVKNSENQVLVRIHTRNELPSNFNEITTGLRRLSLEYEYPAVRSDPLCSFSNVTDLRVELPNGITSLDFLQCYRLNSFYVDSEDLTDINKLRQFNELHSVYLREFANLRDVSSLRNLKKVSIHECRRISDLSESGNHEEFYLLSSSGNSMSCLFKFPSKMSSLTLRSDLSQVNLNDYFDRDFDCNSCCVVNFGDFAMKFPSNLGINNLYLRRFHITKNRFNPTSPLRELRLIGIVSENLDISNFCNLQVCIINNSATLKSITVNTPYPVDIIIDDSEMLERINKVGCVECLVIRNCKNFKDPSMLGAVNRLMIIECPINSLKGLQNVLVITIKNCPLNNLDGLGWNNEKVLIEGVSKKLVKSFHHGKYSYLKQLISDIKVSI
jgi:hypothetical protein